ncbi:hypothetical protein [Pseudoxanthomonas mexicana]|uniref:hypothetical protein n=1 Tax=Pseudoxanthomonas mexicana TaxID=128785 RepID=UPI00398B99FA
MSRPWSYLAAAFSARPLGMPIPPNWLGLAAFALAGAFLSPGFYLLGAGAEAIYLYWLANNPRFRNSVDAAAPRPDDPADRRYRELLEPLPAAQRHRQQELEARAREIMALLTRSPIMAAHADSLEQLVWLHLRLLVARSAIARVVQTAREESKPLQAQEDAIDARLRKDDLGAELRRSLEQQKAVIDQRQAAHADAARRLEHVDAELQRIGLQVALLREQALLATDEGSIGSSLDALDASFKEANRWLDGQRDLLGAFDLDAQPRLPAGVLRPPVSRSAMTEGESS